MLCNALVSAVGHCSVIARFWGTDLAALALRGRRGITERLAFGVLAVKHFCKTGKYERKL